MYSICLISCVFLLPSVYAQDISITLNNSSFESHSREVTQLRGWESCGYHSTPDILPGSWGVYQQPTDGYTYIGLISREDNTWEKITQKLSTPLNPKKCYKFSVALSRSVAYAGYDKPLRLRVWAGHKPCERKQLLANSPTIDHSDWMEYTFMFSPRENYPYIVIECYYKESTMIPYRGNILIDGISPFMACSRA